MGRWDDLIRITGMASQPNPGRLRAMLAARRAMVDQQLLPGNVPQLRSRSPDTAHMAQDRDLWPQLDTSDTASFGARLGKYMDQVGDNERVRLMAENARTVIDNGALGVFSTMPERSPLGVVTYRAGDRATRRHEVMHGYNEAALRGYEGMPAASRVIGWLNQSPYGRPLGRVLDEAVAQRVGGASLADIPWHAYASTYSNQGDVLAARIAQSMEVIRQLQHEIKSHPERVAAAIGGGAAVGRVAALGKNAAEDWMEDDGPQPIRRIRRPVELPPLPEIEPLPQ